MTQTDLQAAAALILNLLHGVRFEERVLEGLPGPLASVITRLVQELKADRDPWDSLLLAVQPLGELSTGE